MLHAQGHTGPRQPSVQGRLVRAFLLICSDCPGIWHLGGFLACDVKAQLLVFPEAQGVGGSPHLEPGVATPTLSLAPPPPEPLCQTPAPSLPPGGQGAGSSPLKVGDRSATQFLKWSPPTPTPHEAPHPEAAAPPTPETGGLREGAGRVSCPRRWLSTHPPWLCPAPRVFAGPRPSPCPWQGSCGFCGTEARGDGWTPVSRPSSRSLSQPPFCLPVLQPQGRQETRRDDGPHGEGQLSPPPGDRQAWLNGQPDLAVFAVSPDAAWGR